MPSNVDTVTGPTRAYVFISYAHADAAYVKVLVAALDAAGVPWWYDERLEGGDRFGRVLAERIDGCAAFVLVMSPAAAASAYVAKEVRRAQRSRRPIYPLLLAGEPLPAVADRQYVSVAGAVPPPARFVDTLRARLTDPPPPARPGHARLVGRGFPRPNPHFVGREALLHQLAEGLLWSPVAVQALHGLGGVGKTQLAAEFAHRHADDYDVIAWIDAENPDLIPGQLAELAPVLGLPSGADVAQTAADVVAALDRTELSWLIVFDNAVRPQDLAPWLPRARKLTGDVIITSRHTQWNRLGHTLDVDVMSRAEAVALLRERVPQIEEAIAVEIVEFLGRLPLAVDLAGGYLATNGTPPAQYLALLREAGDGIDAYLDESEEQRLGYRHTIATVWGPTRADLAVASPAADQLLRLCAFLAPEPIPLDLFTAHPGVLPHPLADAAVDPAAFERTVGELLRRSLARRDADGLTIHRLLAATIRQHLPDADRQAAAGVVRELLFEHLPAYRREEHLAAWPPLLPHVLTAVDHPGPPDRTAWLLGQAGLHLTIHGQAVAARPLLERALRTAEATVGPDHPTVATALSNLALALRELGQAGAAQPLLERALTIDEAAFGPDDPAVATDLSNLAGVLLELGQAGAAQPVLERALRIGENTYGPDHPEVTTNLNNLAMVLKDLGQAEAAQPLLERALRIDENTYGPDHPLVAIRLTNLALVLKDLGQAVAAQPLLERALTIDEATFGPDHPTVAADLSNLATVLKQLGQVEAAQPLLERALRIDENTYGPDHPALATRSTNLAAVLRGLGQSEAARPLLERALRIDENAYGPNHPVVAVDLSNLAMVLKDLGQTGAARSLLKRAIRVAEATLGRHHPKTRFIRNNMESLVTAGRPAATVRIVRFLRRLAGADR